MAKCFVIELIDDLDGSEATETIRFGLDGTDYDIDLGQKNAEELRAALSRFVGAGRRADGYGRGGRARPAALVGTNTKAVRRWAAENGVEVNARGRIKDDVVRRYLASCS